MTRAFLGLAAAAAIALVLVASSGAGSNTLRPRLHCDDNAVSCAEADINIGYGGTYVGHDEPSLLFYSNTPGSGNSNMYASRCRRIRRRQPTQDGTAGTWNFQLHPAFWFGMAMCDDQSAPGVHARAVHARQRHEHLRQRRPEQPELHRASIPGTRVHGDAVLPARLGAVAGRHQL